MHSADSDLGSSEGFPRYSIVIPVYGNEGTIATLLERLELVQFELDAELEGVFVVDGSPDGSLILLRRMLAGVTFTSQLIAHSRNFGSFAAIRTGLAAAQGEFVAVMAADLQEPPELMPRFFAALADGTHQVAVGTRTSRQDPGLSSVVARVFWVLYRRLVNPDIPRGGVDVFACTRAVADRLVAIDESHTSLVGLLFWLGYERAEIPYRRQPRHSGRSGWSFRKKLRYFVDSVFSFTDLPITVLTAIGIVGGAVTLLASGVVLVARMTGRIGQAGYTPLMLVLLMSTFTILFALGVVGSYVWRTYENSKGRPGAIAMSHERFGRDGRSFGSSSSDHADPS